jgi:hypothetical protein
MVKLGEREGVIAARSDPDLAQRARACAGCEDNFQVGGVDIQSTLGSDLTITQGGCRLGRIEHGGCYLAHVRGLQPGIQLIRIAIGRGL